MITSIDLLTLAQWLSPAYPVGAFAYSHGLETAINDGAVADAKDLESWVSDVLRFGSGRNDALFLGAAYRADNAARINRVALALATSKERRIETQALGAAFAEITRKVWRIDLPALCYPVAVGRAAALRDLPLHMCSAMFLHAFASTLVSVGQKLVPIGQTEAQLIISGFAGLCDELARETSRGDLESVSSTAFMSDISAMRHESQNSRVFRT